MACNYTETQYLALSEAISLGATKVQYGDKSVDYRSLDEMLRLQSIMKSCLYPSQTNSGSNARRYASFSKGTGPRRCR